MRRKLVRTRKKTWKLRNRLDVEDWLSIIMAIIIVTMILIKIILGEGNV